MKEKTPKDEENRGRKRWRKEERGKLRTIHDRKKGRKEWEQMEKKEKKGKEWIKERLWDG